MGYVYCFENDSMPGLLKIGMTERTPEERLSEANGADTWRPPTPFSIVVAKRVNDPKIKEKKIHAFLEDERVNREFFRISKEKVKLLFDLIGESEVTDYEPLTPPREPYERTRNVKPRVNEIEAMKGIKEVYFRQFVISCSTEKGIIYKCNGFTSNSINDMVCKLLSTLGVKSQVNCWGGQVQFSEQGTRKSIGELRERWYKQNGIEST